MKIIIWRFQDKLNDECISHHCERARGGKRERGGAKTKS